jgi:hypothetical protein
MSEKITLDGRSFELVTHKTIERELYVASLARRAGIDAMPPDPGETRDQFSWRLYFRMLEQGVLLPLLASQITPAGTEWSVEEAPATTRLLGKVFQGADRRRVQSLLALVAAEFVETGVLRPWGAP